MWTLGERCVSHRWLSSKWPSVTPLTNLVTSFHCKKGHSDDHEEDSRTLKPRSRVSGLENMAESRPPCWKLGGRGQHLHTADNQGLAALSCVWGVVISALAASREKWHLKRALVDLCVCPCSCNEVACALWYNGRSDCYSNFISKISNKSLRPKLKFLSSNSIHWIVVYFFWSLTGWEIGASYFFQRSENYHPSSFATFSLLPYMCAFGRGQLRKIRKKL